MKMRKVTPDDLNAYAKNTMMEVLGIRFIATGEDFLEAEMPVDRRTHQPRGILHGGASVALAETLGSVGASLTIDLTKFRCVGLEINANHVRSVSEGKVVGRAEPVHLGRSTQIWDIKITNEENKLVCVSRLTVGIIPAKTE